MNDAPQSILPEDKYSALTKIAQGEGNDDLISELRNVIASLPLPHQKVLHRFILFAVKIQKNSSVNKMETLSLSVILGPLLLRSPISQVAQQHDNAACVKLAFKLIEYHTPIFEGIALNLHEANGFKARTFVDGTKYGMGDKRSFKEIKMINSEPGSPNIDSPLRITSHMKSKSTDSILTPPSIASIRSFYESAVKDLTLAYEKAKENRVRILQVAKQTAVNEWKGAKERAEEQDKIYNIVCKKYLAKKETVDNATQAKEEAVNELNKLRSFYLVSPDHGKWETISGATLLVDEIAHLQELQALADLREAELKLTAYDLQHCSQEKISAETPHEIAQAALWQAVEELKRLGLTEEDAEKWNVSGENTENI